MIAAAAAATLALSATVDATSLEKSANPPPWTHTSTKCVSNLFSLQHPSGIVGYEGYNVYLLQIVRHRGVTCPQAKRLAFDDWTHGPSGQPLHWRYVRAWRSTAGSGYVGDFVGNSRRASVEYFALH
jgi:hypothetical protein